ncbi:hypothetical protein TRICI_004138 [Trichomonascus ciferrii]|uniref:Uncharacterized protein n=1 Tax=Trichomonascus ciferrii TaxID=44093 RepID=A0A642V1T5_9ASCO|nr:hypothetical protein TRICI_004138 [Trichomonascus ciferrii]
MITSKSVISTDLSEFHTPRPTGLVSLDAMGKDLCLLFVEASQIHGGAGGQPPANPNPVVVFWGHAPSPPGLAPLDAMGESLCLLFVEASQSHIGLQKACFCFTNVSPKLDNPDT